MTSPSEPSREESKPDHESAGRPFSPVSLLVAAGLAAVALVALLFVFGGGSSSDSADGGDSGFRALAFTTESGDTADLNDYVGQPLVVNFFAAWCAPCRRELPDFEAVATDNLDTVKFLGVSHDLDESTWRNLVAETGVTFETVFQPGSEIHTAVEAQGMPTTIFVSADGELLDVHTGLMTADVLQDRIDELLLDA
jgi:thiol-disulfide isomerase/thioredoxin